MASRPPTATPWLSVTFDDGYQDAADYIASRASKFPGVEWIYFVCPEKTEQHVGFRWDHIEEGAPQAGIHDALDVDRENARPDLKALGTAPQFELASVAMCQSLAKLPNVFLGNHTNSHFKQTLLTSPQVDREYERSFEIYERLFGKVRHFAFPFGTPELEFNAEHVAKLRARGDFLIWTTERRPYAVGERRPGAVLPRFPVRGNWTAKQLALWVAARATIFRARGTRYAY